MAPIVLVYVLTLVVNFVTVVYSTVSSFHTVETQARKTLVMPNLFSSFILHLVFGVVLVFFITATDVSIVGSTSTILQYLFAVAAIIHAVLTLVFVFIRAKEARGTCNNLFRRVTGRSAKYSFKPTYKTSVSGEIAVEENEYTTMSMMESVKKRSPEVEEEVRPLRQESPESDAEPAKVYLANHTEQEEEEQETVMNNGGAEDSKAEDSEAEDSEAEDSEAEEGGTKELKDGESD